MHAVGDLDGRSLRVREAGGAGAERIGQELPARLGLDRGVNGGKAAAVLDVAFERRLLRVVEDLARRVQEHHHAIAGEIRGP